MANSIVFENARVLDGTSVEGEHDRHIRIDSGLIEEVSDKPIKDSSARRINLAAMARKCARFCQFICWTSTSRR